MEPHPSNHSDNPLEHTSTHPPKADSNTQNFLEKLYDYTGTYLINVGTLLKECPKSPEISDKLLNLSLNTANNFTQSFFQTHQSSQNSQPIFQTDFLPLQISKIYEKANKPLIEMDFRYVFEDPVESMDQALEILNIEAAKSNYKFKKGVIDKAKGYASLYCKYKPCINPEKCKDTQKKDQDRKLKEEDIISCGSYYRFKDNYAGGWLLKSFDLNHTHQGIDVTDLTTAMKQDLQYIVKAKSIPSIIEFLESKYHIEKLNYQKVYYYFRKIRPLLGPNDCMYFYTYLLSKNFIVYQYSDNIDKTFCKLLFISPIMLDNYKSFGDIILIDATYNTNIYKVPLVVFTGIGADGRNIVLGMAFVNDETFQTYEWIIKNFLAAHEDIAPKLVVTEGDPSLCKVITNLAEKYNTKHIICQWHFSKNLRRHFAYLKRSHIQEYDLVLCLPYVNSSEKFNENYQILENLFNSSQSFKNSLDYLHEINKYKDKWADAFKPLMFTAGTNTTSRAESVNRFIKRYLSSSSELSSAIQLIQDLDTSAAFQIIPKNSNKTSKKDFKTDLIMANIKEELGDSIFQKHLIEYIDSGDYFAILTENINKENESNFVSFKVNRTNAMDATGRIVNLSDEKVECSCHLYFTDGILCRHMFAVMKVQQIKDVTKYLHLRWRVKLYQKQQTHNFTREFISEIKNQEDLRAKNQEDEMEKFVHFSDYLGSFKKREDNSGQIEDNKSEVEEKDNKTFNHVQTEREENIVQHPDSDKEPIQFKNFKVKKNNKGRPATDNKKREEDEEKIEEIPGDKEELTEESSDIEFYKGKKHDDASESEVKIQDDDEIQSENKKKKVTKDRKPSEKKAQTRKNTNNKKRKEPQGKRITNKGKEKNVKISH